ncbi:MAG: hypothetical protein O3C34_00220 [Proteobacteria bacterium]|nr:hypothetical protein [Pseudomonadota bacterium]
MLAFRNPVKLLPALRRTVFAALATVALSACTSDVNGPLEGIGYREARFEQISIMRDYRACRDQGVELDRQARSSGTSGTYLASAQVLEKCETGLGPDAAGIARDERMRAYALSVQNFFKGGNVEKARDNFGKFKNRFADYDFYYPDGTSFVTTMEALLGQRERWTFGEFSALNINDGLKSEMRRVLYWKNK